MFEYAKKLSKLNYFNMSYFEENVHLITYSLVVFLVPFLIGHPQFLVGTIVNTTLILSAVYLKSYKLLPVILLPSLAVLSKGIIFGQFTMFLLYLVPFVWIGNTILVYGYKLFYLKSKMNYFVSLIISSALKTLFLFASAAFLVKLNVIPAFLMGAMGALQMYTAVTGGILALGIIKVRENFIKKS